MKKNNNWLIAGGILTLTVGLVGTIFVATSDFGKTPIVHKEKTAVVQKQKVEVKPTKNTGEVKPVMTPYSSLITPVGTGDKEFPEEQTNTFKEKLMAYAEAGDIDAIIDEVEKRLGTYRFSSEGNLEIAGIYGDASFMKGLVGKKESEMRKAVPGAFKTPEMMAIMTLYLPESARRDVIRDDLSLTPLADGPWKVLDHRYIKNEKEADEDESYDDNGVATSMFNILDGLHQIHVVEMNRELDPDVHVRAYIGELANGKLVLYGYYIPDGTVHYYQNIQYFEKIDEEYLKPNEEYQKDRINEELKKGNLPKEAVDKFLNPNQ